MADSLHSNCDRFRLAKLVFTVRETGVSQHNGEKIEDTLPYDSAVVYERFQGCLQFVPHDAEKLLISQESCTSDRCCFFLGFKSAYILRDIPDQYMHVRKHLFCVEV